MYINNPQPLRSAAARAVARASKRKRTLRLAIGIVGCGLVIAATPVPASAEPPSSTLVTDDPASADEQHDGQAVTWSDIVRAVDRDPRLAAAQLEVAAAAGAVRLARSIPNPSLAAAFGHGEARDSGQNRFESEFELTIPLDWIARYGPKVETATAEWKASRRQADALRRDVLQQMRTLFWAVACDQERVVVLATLHARTLEMARSVRRRIEQGEDRPVQQARVELELENAAADLEEARLQLAVDRHRLGLVLGGRSDVHVAADLRQVPRARALDPALADADSTHPAIRAAEARIRARSADLATARRARVPAVAVKGFALDELDRRAYGAGISLELPLWNWNSAGVAQAQARLAASRRELEAQRRDLASSIVEAHGACETASQTATRIRDRVLPLSERTASTIERTYQLGDTGLLEALDAQRVLAETHRRYLDALGQAHVHCGRFDALAEKGEDK